MLANFESSQLLSKQGIVTVYLASELLKFKPGQRLETMKTYANRINSGVGTVQSAMIQLIDSGGVSIKPKGQLGTFIESLDYQKLYPFTLRGPIVGSMPLPYSRRYEGLATGLRENFISKGIDINLTFIRGSANRLSALEHLHNDFAVMSRMALERSEEEGMRFDLKYYLGQGTYVRRHLFLFGDSQKTGISDGMIIGVDHQSADHTILIKRACEGHQVKLVHMSYMQLLPALITGKIDATVWNEDDLINSHPDLLMNTSKVVDTYFTDLYPKYSEAVLIVSEKQPGIANLLEAILDKDQIIKIQDEVILNNRLPFY